MGERLKKIILFDAYKKLKSKNVAEKMMELILEKLHLYSQKEEFVNFAHEGNDYEDRHAGIFNGHSNIHIID